MADHHVDRRAGPAAADSGRGADAALVRQRPCRDGKIVMAKVTLQGVKKNYGPVRAIHGIDMEIADGEFIVIVGPSGRSEERRVGKEGVRTGRSRWSTDHEKKKNRRRKKKKRK